MVCCTEGQCQQKAGLRYGLAAADKSCLGWHSLENATFLKLRIIPTKGDQLVIVSGSVSGMGMS
jgi:hypothetical protein